MKKLISIILVIVVMTCVVACNKQQNGVIKVNEVTHSIFYAPFYVAIEKDYFEEEGLTIELTNGGGSDASMTALLSGSSDISLLGPETGIYTVLGDAKDKPVVFAQLTKRDGSFLVSRDLNEDFDWKKLKDKEIIAGRRGGSPAMSLEYALNKNVLFDKENVTLNFDIQFNLTTAAFESGTGDYVTMFEPTASEYQRLNKGKIVASVGLESGEIPFTCFMAKQSYFDKNKETLEKFTTALFKAIKFINDKPVEEVAKVLEKSFPSTTLQSIIDSINSYKNIDAWQTDMQMTKDSFTRLQDVMKNAGELDKTIEFNELINNEIANKTYKKVFG